MAGMTNKNWSFIRRRIVEMALNDINLASPNDAEAQVRVYEDATVQKFIHPLIHTLGEDYAFSMFCEEFDKAIDSAVETGVIADSDLKKKKKPRRRRLCSEDELSAPNSGIAG
jgi:hypothetical protein